MNKVILFCLLPVLFLPACQRSEEEGITRVLIQREEAFGKKDLSSYLSCISKEYLGKDENFDQLKDRIERYFRTFDRIEYRSWGRSLYVEGEEARVIQQFHLEVERGGEVKRYTGKESLFLRKQGGVWKIAGGL